MLWLVSQAMMDRVDTENTLVEASSVRIFLLFSFVSLFQRTERMQIRYVHSPYTCDGMPVCVCAWSGRGLLNLGMGMLLV